MPRARGASSVGEWEVVAATLGAARAAARHRDTATPAALRDALAWMADVGASWDDRLDRLAQRSHARSAAHQPDPGPPAVR